MMFETPQKLLEYLDENDRRLREAELLEVHARAYKAYQDGDMVAARAYQTRERQLIEQRDNARQI